MSSLYLWIKFIHVVAGFTFFMGHGAAIAFAFRVKAEKGLERVRAMSDLSQSMWPVYMLSWLILLAAGIVNGFMGKWWSQGWMWVSLALMLAITVWMFRLNYATYQPLRQAYGMTYRDLKGEKPAEPAMEEEERVALIAATKPMEMLVIGYGGFILILWLMIFKPF